MIIQNLQKSHCVSLLEGNVAGGAFLKRARPATLGVMAEYCLMLLWDLCKIMWQFTRNTQRGLGYTVYKILIYCRTETYLLLTFYDTQNALKHEIF